MTNFMHLDWLSQLLRLPSTPHIHGSRFALRTYSLEADVGESHSSEGWAHLPPHDGAVAHVALEGVGRQRERRRRQDDGDGHARHVESHRGRGGGDGHLTMVDGVVVVVILTWKGAR